MLAPAGRAGQACGRHRGAAPAGPPIPAGRGLGAGRGHPMPSRSRRRLGAPRPPTGSDPRRSARRSRSGRHSTRRAAPLLRGPTRRRRRGAPAGRRRIRRRSLGGRTPSPVSRRGPRPGRAGHRCGRAASSTSDSGNALRCRLRPALCGPPGQGTSSAVSPRVAAITSESVCERQPRSSVALRCRRWCRQRPAGRKP